MHFTLLTFIVNIHTETSYICFQIMFDYLYTLQSFMIYLVQNTGFLHPLKQRHAPLSNPRYHHPLLHLSGRSYRLHFLFGVPRIFSFLMGLVLESRVDLGCFKILPCIILYLLKCNNPDAPYSFETSWFQRQALYRNFNIRHFWGIFVPVLLHVTFNNNLSNESFKKHLFYHYYVIISVS